MTPHDSLRREIIVKRAFKKSLRGCRACKARKVKCDEVHPLCGQCARRFVGLESCDFDRSVEKFVKPIPGAVPGPSLSTKRGEGCRTCKVRKVKCDNGRPLCGNCARRFVGLSSCDFDPSSSPASETSPNVVPKVNNSILPSKDPQCSPNQLSLLPGTINEHAISSRTLELRLMHHYMAFTSTQFPSASTAQGAHVWAISIPRLAFHSELVLNALLGISALHLWALCPDDEGAEFASRRYFDKAVRMHRLALGNSVTRESSNESGDGEYEGSVTTEGKNDSVNESAEALLATAILITHHSWVAAPTDCGYQNHGDSDTGVKYRLPLQTYYMARGVQALTAQMWPHLTGSGYLWYVEGENPVEETQLDGVSESPFMKSVKEDLAQLEETFSSLDVNEEDRDAYYATVVELRAMSYTIASRPPLASSPLPAYEKLELMGLGSMGENSVYASADCAATLWLEQIHRRLATMPLRLPPRFLELVEQHDPRALALLARNLALFKPISSIWWLHGVGKHGVTESAIKGIGSLLPDKWTWVMDWPQEIIARDLEVTC